MTTTSAQEKTKLGNQLAQEKKHGLAAAAEPIKAWVTKYALTDGILVIDAVVQHGLASNMIVATGGQWARYFHGKDWHRTLDAAVARVEQMRIQKIKALEKQLAKLEALDVTKICEEKA